MASLDELELAGEYDAPTIEVPAAGSVLDVIRARRRELAADERREYDMRVPGFGGLLVLRCEALHGSFLTTLRTRVERSRDPERDFAANADVLINVCVDVLARRSPDAELEPLDPTREPVTIGERLGELLQFDGVTTSRQVVRALFAAAPSPEIALGVAMNDYLAWAQGADVEIDEELRGES